MKYVLMHKNIEVLLMEIDEDNETAKPKTISINPTAKDHIPLGGQMNNMKFMDWWRDRAIPKTRQGAKTALERLNCKSVTNIMVQNLALSLNDCYWIRPINSNLRWEEVNLFTNQFEDVFGELTFTQDDIESDLRKKTRFFCAVSQGEVQKKWCIDNDNRRYLIKGNYGNSYQQSINEVFASNFHKQQGIDFYTPYYLTKIKLVDDREGLGCYSYNFCSENIESISAWELLQTTKIRQNQSLFHPFKQICLSLGINEDYFNKFISYEIMSDFLFDNLDRHMNNISILRNPDTLEILGFAPIYDTGNSMYYKNTIDDINKIELGKEKTHSFVSSQESKLLQYVENKDILDLNKIDMDFSIYEKDIIENHIKIPLLKENFEKKMIMLSSFQQGRDIWKSKIHFITNVPQNKTLSNNIDIDNNFNHEL